MKAYCKNCRQTHAVWNRLNNDSLICGHCGARVKETELKLVTPLSVDDTNGKIRKPQLTE